MNGEIYLLNDANSSVNDDDKFKKAVELFKQEKLNILYKTKLDNNKDKLSKAFIDSKKSKEKIKFILIPNALNSDDKEKAQEFFESIGLDKKVHIIRGNLSEKPTETNQVVEISGNINSKNKKSEPQNKGEICAFYMEYKGIYVVAVIKEECIGFTYTEIIEKALLKYVHQWTSKKKIPFWQRFIPYKGDSVLEVIRKIILIIAIIVFIVSAGMLINELVIVPMQHQNTQNNIKNLYIPDDDTDNDITVSKIPVVNSEGEVVSYIEPKDGNKVLKDFNMLLAVNPDTAGWIKINNTQVDNVVVYRPSDRQNEYYLTHDFYGNTTKYGTVFVDYRSYDGVKSKNIILHGHHMNDGSMFGGIVYTYEKLDFYKENPMFTFNTIYEKAEWKVIAVCKFNVNEEDGPTFNYFKGAFSSDSDFLNYIYQMRERSIIDCPVDVSEDDTIVTLSTCSYEFGKDMRTVVVARKVREGESSEVDVSKAKYNDNPLMPYIWYDIYGGTPPQVTVFEEAYQNGLTDWYLNPNNQDWSNIPEYSYISYYEYQNNKYNNNSYNASYYEPEPEPEPSSQDVESAVLSEPDITSSEPEPIESSSLEESAESEIEPESIIPEEDTTLSVNSEEQTI